MKSNTQILISTILLAVGAFLETQSGWFPILGGVLLAIGGVFGGTGGQQKYKELKK
jgi:hypothetical protein